MGKREKDVKYKRALCFKAYENNNKSCPLFLPTPSMVWFPVCFHFFCLFLLIFIFIFLNNMCTLLGLLISEIIHGHTVRVYASFSSPSSLLSFPEMGWVTDFFVVNPNRTTSLGLFFLASHSLEGSSTCLSEG